MHWFAHLFSNVLLIDFWMFWTLIFLQCFLHWILQLSFGQNLILNQTGPNQKQTLIAKVLHFQFSKTFNFAKILKNILWEKMPPLLSSGIYLNLNFMNANSVQMQIWRIISILFRTCPHLVTKWSLRDMKIGQICHLDISVEVSHANMNTWKKMRKWKNLEAWKFSWETGI